MQYSPLRPQQIDMEAEIRSEARGPLVAGTSGAGKTRILRRVFRHHTQKLTLLEDAQPNVDVVSLSIPSPATPKGVGIATLHALGCPLNRERTSQIIWGLVQTHLERRKALFLHFDEAQDFSLANNDRDMRSVINTLKSIMQHTSWPTPIILSGMPFLLELVNLDPQLARRFEPVLMHKISVSSDSDLILSAIKSYAISAEVELSDKLLSQEFIRRLVHASDCCFGILIEIFIAAIGECFLGGSKLAPSAFAKAFADRSGCPIGVNPMVCDHFETINVRKLLEVEAS